ncbi:hypothetical protein AB0K34_37110 [Actinomadura sp. NPDC049382]|uniref:hypothetical protein n=1 Tax=Actinomadura sp. NPDC049382 TaxID=3158220 RepID=UPI00343B5438
MAANTATAHHLVNAVVQQYLIPATHVGVVIPVRPDGDVATSTSPPARSYVLDQLVNSCVSGRTSDSPRDRDRMASFSHWPTSMKSDH